MTASPPLTQTVQPEHRIFWTARASNGIPSAVPRGFFARYARSRMRSFPWRKPEITPFHLLIAELLLVQTKAEDVAKIWPILITRYPLPQRLQRAQTGSLTRLLRPLGLQNQRAKALKALSRAIVDRFGGNPPQSIPELLSLPHVGLYVASAVACFNFGQRVPIVDANVLRVLGRITGIEPGRELRRSPRVWEAAWSLLPRSNFALHNYGLLDFAAQVCRTKAPLCSSCALNTTCAHARTTLQNDSDAQPHVGAECACSI
jgi:A/G-specific adenine glycosylase